MISVANANAYFSGHTLAKAWGEYSGAQKSSAIDQAKRELSADLGRPMAEDEPDYRLGDQTRDEYAVYEQAIYLLLRNVHPEGSGSATPALEGENVATLVPASVGGRWSSAAIHWLGGRVNTRILT